MVYRVCNLYSRSLYHWEIKYDWIRMLMWLHCFNFPTHLGFFSNQLSFWKMSPVFFFLFHYTVYANPGVIGCLWKWFPHYCPFTLFMRVIKLSTWSNHTYQLEVSLCHSRSSNNLFLRYPAGSTFFFPLILKKMREWGKRDMGMETSKMK